MIRETHVESLSFPGAPPTGDEGNALILERLAERLRSNGLAVHPFSAPLAVALRGLDSRPLFTLDRDQRPISITRVLGSRVRVEDPDGSPEWLEREELLARLGTGPQSDHIWLAPEALPPQPANESSIWKKVVELLRPEGADITVIAIYAVGVGLLSLALPVAVQVLVNTVAFGTLVQPIVVLSILLGIGLAFAASLRALQAWVVELVQRRVFVRLVSSLSDRLPRVHVRAFERAHGPELVNRFFDVFTAQKAVASILFGGVEAALTALVGLIVLSFYHPVLLGLGVVILLGVAAIVFGLGRGGTLSSVQESKAKYAVAGWLEEMARHLFTLKIAGGSEFARVRLDALAGKWLDARAAHFRVLFRQVLGALGLQVMTSVTLLGVGGWLVVERELTIGQLVAAELIVTAVVAALSKLGGKLESAYDLAAAADKLTVLLSLPLERTGGLVPAFDDASRLTLRSVSSEDGTLDGLDLAVAGGEHLAIVGTARERRALGELIFGMRDPVQGTVTIDGHDLREVDLLALRRQVAVVREPEILPGTIADNVRATRRELSSDKLWSLLEQVGLGEEVRALPEGIHTKLTPTGFPLSLEATLRLTLARALASEAHILVLDGVLERLGFGGERTRSLVGGERTVLALGEQPASFCARTVFLNGDV